MVEVGDCLFGVIAVEEAGEFKPAVARILTSQQ
jgi:hypothetical protein